MNRIVKYFSLSDLTNKVLTRDGYTFEPVDLDDKYNDRNKYETGFKYFEMPESNYQGYVTVTTNIGLVFIYEEEPNDADNVITYIYDILSGFTNIPFDNIQDKDEQRHSFLINDPENFHQLVCYIDNSATPIEEDSVSYYPLYTELIVSHEGENYYRGIVDMYAKSNIDIPDEYGFIDDLSIIRDSKKFNYFEFYIKNYFTIKNVDKVELYNMPESMRLLHIDGTDKYYISFNYLDDTIETVKFKFYASSDRIIEVI